MIFQVSSAVEQWTVNPLVVGSNPTLGDIGIGSTGCKVFLLANVEPSEYYY